MKIDIIIGNPPYQEETGAGTIVTGKKPIYQNFVVQGMNITNKVLCMIIPSRWTMCGNGLEELFSRFEHEKQHLRSITDYLEWSTPVFGGNVQIAGGVMYFVYDKEYNGQCEYKNIVQAYSNTRKRDLIFKPAFIRNNKLLDIVLKVQKKNENTLIKESYSSTFGLDSFERGDNSNEIKLLTSSEICSIQRDKIKQGISLIDKYKLAISGTTPGGGAISKDGKYKVLAKVEQLKVGEVCTNTYIVVGNFTKEIEMINLQKYLQTKFVRALIQATVSSMHIIPYSFTLVPMQDFEVEWTDEMLYNKYELDTKEIAYIENIIKNFN